MPDELSIKDYHNPIFWVIITLTVITIILGISEMYYSHQLTALIAQQDTEEQYNARITDIVTKLTDAETGQRGYLITQNQSYLQPYYSALPSINSDLSYLQKSSVSNKYKAQVVSINSLVNAKLNELSETITLQNTQGQSASFAVVNTNKGRALMDSIRSKTGNILSQQTLALESKINSTRRQSTIVEFLAPFAALINVGLIYEVLYLARVAVRKERQLEGTREQFVTVASHQLRTPATAVKQYLYLLLDGYYGKLSEDQHQVLELINSSNERGISVANSLLSVTRADSGQINISERPINLNQLILDIVNEYKVAILERKNQQIIANLPKTPVKAKVDSFYMKMVFENLIDNASKYSAKGKKIYIDMKTKNDKIVITVRDQGIGVKEKDIPKLFKKFSRLNSSFKINSEGSGLGLYLVKQLVSLHGGEIKVASEYRKGSTFTIKLNVEGMNA